MNIAKWRYKLEFLCVMMLFVLAVGVAYSENVGQETKTINNMPAYLTIGTNLLYWAALAPNVTAEYYFPDSHWSISGTFTMPWWKRKSKHQYYQIRQYLMEGRYWLPEGNIFWEPISMVVSMILKIRKRDIMVSS